MFMQSNKAQAIAVGFSAGAGVNFLTVQIKEIASQFSIPLYLPPGQKKRGVSGHIN